VPLVLCLLVNKQSDRLNLTKQEEISMEKMILFETINFEVLELAWAVLTGPMAR
jgi:hypothetical protein